MKANRKLEKKTKELQLQAEDEKRHADQCKDQVRRLLTIWHYYLYTNVTKLGEDHIFTAIFWDENFIEYACYRPR